MRRLVNVLLFCAVLLFPLPYSSFGATCNRYASNSGSGTYAQSTNINTPMSYSTAWSSASAGDVICFRGGTYSVSQHSRSGNHGTSGSPITFQNYPGETVTWNAGSVIPVNVLNTNYVVIDNVNFVSRGTWFYAGEDNPIIGFTYKNSTCSMSVGDGDNSGCMKIYNGSNITITNNTMTGPGQNGSGQNANVAAIWLDQGVHNFLVKNNTVRNFYSAFYFKHPNSNSNYNDEVSYNYFYDNYWGIHTTSNYTLFKHNILKNGQQDVYSGDDGGGSNGGQHNTYDHNTIAGPLGVNFQNAGAVGPSVYNTFTNNVMTKESIFSAYTSENLYLTMNYNLYPSGNVVQYHATHYTLSSWRTYLGQDGNSISGAPTFVGGASPSTIAGFALTAGSNGRNAASDGTDMGADVSKVGPTVAPTIIKYPSIPVQININ